MSLTAAEELRETIRRCTTISETEAEVDATEEHAKRSDAVLLARLALLMHLRVLRSGGHDKVSAKNRDEAVAKLEAAK